MPWKGRFPSKRSSDAEDISAFEAGPEYGTSSKVKAGKSLEYGLNEGREDIHIVTPDAEKTIEHLEKVEHHERVEEKQPNRRQKLQRHCGRRWKWYLAGTVIFLAIMLPVFFLVIFPAIVQRLIDDSDLPIHEGAIRAVDPDTVELSVVVGLSVPGGFTVKLDPITLFFYNRDAPEYSPWTRVSVGEQQVSGESNITVDKYMADITDQEEFGRFLDDLFANPTALISATADGTVRLGALKADIDLTKTITVNGLDRLRGFGFETLRVILPPEEDGTNIRGVLNLPNHSDMRLQLGNITFNVLTGDLVIGKVETWNTDVFPGNNSVDFFGEVYIQTMLENVGTVLRSQSSALADGMLELATTGNQTTVDGVRIPYVEKVLAPRIETRAPLLEVLGNVLGGFLDSPVLEDPIEILEDLFEGLDGNRTENDDGDSEPSIFDGLDESFLENRLGKRAPAFKKLALKGYRVLKSRAPILSEKLEAFKDGRIVSSLFKPGGMGVAGLFSVAREILETKD